MVGGFEGYANVLSTSNLRRGYIKCRLVHLFDRSFVMPDVLMVSGLKRVFYLPNFFMPNMISFFGGDTSNDYCRMTMELMGGVEVQITFFKADVVKKCADKSFIYKCAIQFSSTDSLPLPQGVWRRKGKRFEISVYHHTNEAGEKGIRSSGEIWSSSWNIQGNQKLKNISYVYFTSIEKIRNEFDLVEIAMSETGAALLLPTNMPPDPTFALPLSVYRQEARDRNKTFKFWVDVEVIYPSHLWLHIKEGDPAYYEVVLPKILRIGVKAGVKIPFKGMSLKIASSDQKSFDYVIVGDADTAEGLAAPYNEEETIYLAKVDNVPGDLEIIGRWYQMKNTHLYPSMDVELAEIVKLPPS